MKHLRLYISFGLAIITGALAFWANLSSMDKVVYIDQKYSNTVQNNIDKALSTLIDENRKIKRTYQDGNNMPLLVLSEQLQYEFFVFKDKELTFWSDFKQVPKYSMLSGNYETKFMELPHGKYIVHVSSFVTGGGSLIEIYSFLPIFYQYKLENVYLKPKYNEKIIPNQEIVITATPSEEGTKIFDTEGGYLFSMDSGQSDLDFDFHTYYLSIVLITVSFVMALLFVKYLRPWLYKAPLIGWLLRTAVLISYRIIFLLYFNSGLIKLDFEIFSPEIYASSKWAPSLMDMLVNTVIALIILVDFGRHYYKSRIYFGVIKGPKLAKFVTSMIIVILSYYLLEIHSFVVSTIYLHSNINLDITKDISVTPVRFLAFLIFVLMTAFYFLGTNLIARTFIQLNRKLDEMSYLLGAGSLIYNIITYVQGTYNWILVLVHGIFFMTSVFLLLPKSLFKFRYLTTVYIFLGMLVGSISGTYIIYKFGVSRTQINKKKYAESLLNEQDLYAEFALEQIHQQISKDLTIKQTMFRPLLLNKDVITQKIKRHYINNSFESYQVSIHSYDVIGQPLKDQNSPPLKTYTDIFQNQEYATQYQEIYFVSETDAYEGNIGANLLKQYVCFVPIYQDSIQLGTIVIDLQQKKDVRKNVYPELLVDTRFKQADETKEYSYAVYQRGKLLYQFGIYNYAKDFRKSFLTFPSLYGEGYPYHDYNHIALAGKNDRVVVVSSEVYSNQKIFANFSALFLTLLIFTMIMLLLYGLVTRSFSFKNTYASRIQLYLNIAFFLPLIVVSTVTLSLVSTSYENDLQNNFIYKAQRASNSVISALQDYHEGNKNKQDLSRLLNKVGEYSEADINLFDKDGKLIATNQPDIYDAGIISKYINPKSFNSIVEQKDNNILLRESVGSLRYRSVYVAVRSLEHNKLLGILSIPFFDAEDEQNKKIIDILSITMSIFTATFILFLVISYFASRILTVPLSIITQRLKKTNLEDTNAPLDWDTEDEIGLLVSEYNRMIINLEENKRALSKSEKESAWREMAKQVAHEIKNPLTPMKLSLQHLKFKLGRTYEDINDMIDKPIGTILEQIDTLSDIATSFSSFAKMPIPKNEQFDMAKVVRNTVNLHRDDKNKKMILHIAKQKFEVNGDEQLMGRIITNLLLNAEQAVSKDKTPEIYINLYQYQNLLRLEIRDNGMGIPKEIQKKIFVPNFSTKFTGSGIGLALAKRGIEHAGGKIWFETEEGHGTCFFIQLPLI